MRAILLLLLLCASSWGQGLPLGAGGTVQGVAGTATAITYTIFGSTNRYGATPLVTQGVLAQGQLALGAAPIYTVPASTNASITTITLANATGSTVSSITLYVNGVAATNQIIPSLTIPAYGSASINGQGVFEVHDSTGRLYISSTAASPAGVAHDPNCTAVVTSTFEVCVFGGDITNSGANLTVAKIQGVTVTGVTGTGNAVLSISPTLTGTPAIAAATGTSLVVTAGLSGATYATATNCADSAGAAACGSASAGAFVIDAGATSTVVSTTAVTANSEIFVQEDSGLSTRLSVTCNTESAATLGVPRVTARTAATSFTVSLEAMPTTNPVCVSYSIKN